MLRDILKKVKKEIGEGRKEREEMEKRNHHEMEKKSSGFCSTKYDLKDFWNKYL